MKKTLAERFWEKVEKRSPEDCWEWTHCRTKFGYGRIANGDGKVVTTHRVSWQIHNGPIPEKMWVLHKCDNPPCVNPDHLFLGTGKENNLDCETKGRARRLHGTDNGNCKYSDEIIEIVRSNTMTEKMLREQYGISRGYVWKVRRGQFRKDY